MKSTILNIIICLSFIGCSLNEITKNSELSKKELDAYESWKIEYKNVTFQRCLYLGLNRSAEIKALMQLDNSTHQDFAFGIEQYRYIDSIVHPIIEFAKIDSTENYQKHLQNINEIERNELNGKPMIKYCLEFYVSGELDKIASERVNQMKFLWQE